MGHCFGVSLPVRLKRSRESVPSPRVPFDSDPSGWEGDVEPLVWGPGDRELRRPLCERHGFEQTETGSLQCRCVVRCAYPHVDLSPSDDGTTAPAPCYLCENLIDLVRRGLLAGDSIADNLVETLSMRDSCKIDDAPSHRCRTYSIDHENMPASEVAGSMYKNSWEVVR